MKSKLVKDYSIWPDQFVVFLKTPVLQKGKLQTLRWFCRLLERIFFEKIRWVKFSPLPGEMMKFDDIIFFKWVETTN